MKKEIENSPTQLLGSFMVHNIKVSFILYSAFSVYPTTVFWHSSLTSNAKDGSHIAEAGPCGTRARKVGQGELKVEQLTYKVGG